MGDNVIFFRPVEKVATIVDVLESCHHTTFPVVDTDDENILFGTISRNVLCSLLKQRSFGRPIVDANGASILSDYIVVHGEKFVPITEYNRVEESYPKYPSVKDIRIASEDRELLVDLRPYTNTAPISVQETASVNVSTTAWTFAPLSTSSHLQMVFLKMMQRAYNVFRTLGLRFLPVVNKRNQIVGTITRTDISPEGLAHTLLKRGVKKHI